jgi:hypothetical protein
MAGVDGEENKKQQIVELALQGKGPSEIEFELKKQGKAVKRGYIWKTLSEARRDGLPIPRFGRDEPKKVAAVERSAKLGALSEARVTQRREVAAHYLKGFEPAEIIFKGVAPQLDALEIIDLCLDLEPVRPPGQWLAYLRNNGYVSQDCNSMQDAASQLVKSIDGLTNDLDRSQKELYALKTDKDQLVGDLKRAKDEGEGHREAGVVARQNYDKLLRCSAVLNALVAKNGLEMTQTLLDRASKPEALQRMLVDLGQQIRLSETSLIATDVDCRKKRQQAKDWCDKMLAETEGKVNQVMKLSGVTKEMLETVDSAANLLATDPDYLAGVMRKMPDVTVRRMASRLTYEDGKRLWDLLMSECTKTVIRNFEEAQIRKYSNWS